MHFCRGNLIELEIWTDVEGCGGKKSPTRKCCKDISVSIEAPGDQVKPASVEVPELITFQPAEAIFGSFEFSYVPERLSIRKEYYPPPDSPLSRIYLHTRSLRL
jgi:hypothetical protein